MRWFKGLALVLGMLSVAGTASAAADTPCDDKVYTALGRQLHVKALLADDRDERIAAQACKTWPYKDTVVLAAIAVAEGAVKDQKTLLVATIDRRTMKVLSSHREKIEEDTLVEFGERSLKLDTAAYRLNADVVAFGLRFNSAAGGASCPEAGWEDELTLFVPAGASLKPVLHLAMRKYRALHGCVGMPTADTVLENANLTIGVETTGSHGYADLSVRAAIDGDAIGKDKAPPPKVERQVLRYDGNQYQPAGEPPWWMQF
jgi:hypothetical protein